MDIFGPGSGNKPIKRTFIEALREFTTTQETPPNKRPPVVPNATDTIRVEINKVFPVPNYQANECFSG
jgi:hypothetical protein